MSQYTASMFKKDSIEPLRLLKKALKIMNLGPSLDGLKFTTIRPERMEVVVTVDAAFATNPDTYSQLVVLAMIRDSSTKTVNVIHFVSSKSKRVCKSALAAELLAMVDGFDVGFSIEKTLVRITDRKTIPLHLVSDSLSLYGLVVSLTQTTKRRLQIDLMMLREAFENREITSVIWTPGNENPADDLTKPDKRCDALAKLLKTGTFDPDEAAWIKRDAKPIST